MGETAELLARELHISRGNKTRLHSNPISALSPFGTNSPKKILSPVHHADQPSGESPTGAQIQQKERARATSSGSHIR